MPQRLLTTAVTAALVLATAAPLAAQQAHILLPVDTIEHRLRHMPFEIDSRTGSRFEGDRTQRVVVLFPDSSPMMVKWGTAPPGGERFNNMPRYELAAYELQKLFLDEEDYVVPPTVARIVPLEWYRAHNPRAAATFGRIPSVLVVLQYWLFDVTGRDVFSAERLRSDTVYARHFGNLNALTYLIRHGDSNSGNVLIAEEGWPPRLFAVDNGVAFLSQESNRGTLWRDMRTDRLPASTVERLRRITRADLDRALGVVAQFEIRDGELHQVERGRNLHPARGVRRNRQYVQIGLTTAEITGVHERLRQLVRDVDTGRYRTF